MTDIELARTFADCGFSGRVSEWPQLRPLLRRMANRLGELEYKQSRAYTLPDGSFLTLEELASLVGQAYDILREKGLI